MSAYGLSKWPARLARTPIAHEYGVIARVQSMRTSGGKVAEPLTYEASVAYLRDAARERRITVPQPLNAGLRSDSAQPSSLATAARAGAYQEMKQ